MRRIMARGFCRKISLVARKTWIARYLWSGGARRSITERGDDVPACSPCKAVRNRHSLRDSAQGGSMADEDVEITGKIRDKLIERKQVWARDGRLLTGTTAD